MGMLSEERRACQQSCWISAVTSSAEVCLFDLMGVGFAGEELVQSVCPG
jgi:hypothetical protein